MATYQDGPAKRRRALTKAAPIQQWPEAFAANVLSAESTSRNNMAWIMWWVAWLTVTRRGIKLTTPRPLTPNPNANMRTIQSLYAEARQAGYSAKHALHTAKTLESWYCLESASAVRLRAEPEEERYIDVYGKPEAFTDGNGHFHSAEDALKDLYDTLERWGCWYLVAEYSIDGGESWEHADSIGMCVYADPLDWRENWYVPDLMANTISEHAKAACPIGW